MNTTAWIWLEKCCLQSIQDIKSWRSLICSICRWTLYLKSSFASAVNPFSFTATYPPRPKKHLRPFLSPTWFPLPCHQQSHLRHNPATALYKWDERHWSRLMQLMKEGQVLGFPPEAPSDFSRSSLSHVIPSGMNRAKCDWSMRWKWYPLSTGARPR